MNMTGKSANIGADVLTVQALRKDNLLDDLANTFGTDFIAQSLLDKFGFPRRNIPVKYRDAQEYWYFICTEIEKGITIDGLATLLACAAEIYPGNKRFARFAVADRGADASSAQPHQHHPSSIVVTEWLNEETLMSLVRSLAETLSIDPNCIEIGETTPTTSSIRCRNLPEERVQDFAKAISKHIQQLEQHAEVSAPEPTEGLGGAAHSIKISGCSDDRSLLSVVTSLASRLSLPRGIVLACSSQGNVSFNLSGFSAEQTRALADALSKEFISLRRSSRVSWHPFHDFLIARLYIQGPDHRRFEVRNVAGTTCTRDVALELLNLYDRRAYPRGASGMPRSFTIDKTDAAGNTVRLANLGLTLHQNDVRDDDTLHVARESTMGSVHPRVREEALARARAQIVAFAEAHEGFVVQANAQHAPTSYLLKFSAAGWAPPVSRDAQPSPIMEHVVSVRLPPDFPMRAPEFVWRTEMFHPNVHPKTGQVCLGLLEHSYQPGLDFSRLCQLLLDTVHYRSYELSNMFNSLAGEWALSPEGQLSIANAGGTPPNIKALTSVEAPRKLKVRSL